MTPEKQTVRDQIEALVDIPAGTIWTEYHWRAALDLLTAYLRSIGTGQDAAIRAERETVARLLDVLHTIISIGCDYDNARTADELKKVIDDLVEIASRAHSGESIYSGGELDETQECLERVRERERGQWATIATLRKALDGPIRRIAYDVKQGGILGEMLLDEIDKALAATEV